MRRHAALGGLLLLSAMVLYGAPTAVMAQEELVYGVRAGYYFDPEDASLGGELLTPVGTDLYFNPNAEFVFIDNGDMFTLNADLTYDFSVTRTAYYWVGAGLSYLWTDPDGPADSNGDAGLNLLVGGALRQTELTPYAQAKLVLSDNSQFVLSAGMRF